MVPFAFMPTPKRVALAVPFTSRVLLGEVVPMPTLPDVGFKIVLLPAPGLMVNAVLAVVSVPPVSVMPFDDASPAAEIPPENVVVPDVAVMTPESSSVSNLMPPTTLNPPPVIFIPPANDEEAAEVDRIFPPVMVNPLEEESPAVFNSAIVEEAVVDFTCKVSTLNPFEKEEVPVTPVNLNPPPVMLIPPEKLEVAVPVTAREVVVACVALKLARVVEPKKEEIPEARRVPPVMVNPLLEDNPTVSNILIVELAVVEVALNVGKVSPEYKVEVPMLKFPTPCTEKRDPGVVVPIPMLPFTIVVSVLASPSVVFPVTLKFPPMVCPEVTKLPVA